MSNHELVKTGFLSALAIENTLQLILNNIGIQNTFLLKNKLNNILWTVDNSAKENTSLFLSGYVINADGIVMDENDPMIKPTDLWINGIYTFSTATFVADVIDIDPTHDDFLKITDNSNFLCLLDKRAKQDLSKAVKVISEKPFIVQAIDVEQFLPL